MKSSYDRVGIPRVYAIQYFAKRGKGYLENFVEAIAFFSNGHTLKETRERWDFSESDETFYGQARNVRKAYIRASREQPANEYVSHQTEAI